MSPPTVDPAAATPTGADRIALVDLLRGAAMFGILAVNTWFFASPSIVLGEPAYLDGTDRFGYGSATLLFATKSYLLFAFLFGYSFVLQERGPGFARRMRRRNAALIALGLLHGLLLFAGDILLTYGVLGFALLAMRALSPRSAVRRGVVLTVFSGGALLLLGVLVIAAGETTAVVVPGAASDLQGQFTGSPSGMLAVNAGLYLDTVVWVLFLQALPALGAMLCGMAAARVNLFSDAAALAALWRRLTPWGPIVGVLGAVVFTALTLPAAPGPALLGLGVTVLTAGLLTATYVALLVRWQRANPYGAMVGAISAVGRLALTNYLGQSVVMALVFSGYGLGWMGQLGAMQTWAVILAVYLVQVRASTWWLDRHRYGPAEWLLRRWTWHGTRAAA